jgi:tetratricopeptide (TPR) repeat protein
VALEHFGDWAGSLAAFEATLECDPEHVDARWNRALALLRRGDVEQGFRDYEWRFRRRAPAPRACAQPVWDGRPLAGERLLVWAEQGLGDMLQFLRFVPELAARGARVMLEVPPSLCGLAQRLPGVDSVHVQGDSPPDFEKHVALMSLPFVLGKRADELAPAGPYLRADPAEATNARRRLRPRGSKAERELAVGLVWAAGPALRNAGERSPGLAALRDLFEVPAVRWFSLQKGAGRDELARGAPASSFVDLDDAIADFDDTAAIVENLDLVVTCDTSVAHLAGALGKPTWVLLPSTPDWRYGLGDDSTPWYPGMRLFRQTARGDWRGVCARVRNALADTVAHRMHPVANVGDRDDRGAASNHPRS